MDINTTKRKLLSLNLEVTSNIMIGRHNPPKVFHRFFLWFCHPSLRKYIEGDLLELYEEQLLTRGKRKADRRFIVDVLLLFRPGIIRPYESHSTNLASMINNYFKVGVRNILKYKVFSFINVFGLAMAMSVCMLVITMLADQKRYDAFHVNRERIYRMNSSVTEGRNAYATSPYPLADALKSDYQIVDETTVLIPDVGGDATYGQRIIDMRGYFAAPSFFEVFSFELQEGDKRTALTSPRSMVISTEMAKKLFGSENAIGKVIQFADRKLPFPQRHDGVGAAPVTWGNFTITGVIDESQYKSHLRFDVLVSSSSLPALVSESKIADRINDWEGYFRCYTFVMLKTGKSEEDLQIALNDLVSRKYAGIKSDVVKGFHLTPEKLSDVPLDLKGNDTNDRLPEMGYFILSILAGIIMLSACLNYINLSIARALTRAKEIGIRKVTGAGRLSLIIQFICESVITSLLALVMAVLMLMAIKPAFKSLWVNKFLNFELPELPSVYFAFIALAIITGIVAGWYPAFYISKYQPVKALKNLDSMKNRKLGARKVLSVLQFVISLFFITTSILIYNQFSHFMHFDYGFKSSNIINIELQGADPEKLSNALKAVPDVEAISASDIIPATGRNNGMQLKRLATNDEFTNVDVIQADDHFIPNLGLKVIAGNNLPPSANASGQQVVVNEAFTRKLGYSNPMDAIGAVFESNWDKEPVQVTGVVQDFRFNLLINRHEIEPLLMRNSPGSFMYLNVKVSSSDQKATIARLEKGWKTIDPVHDFKYAFFDDQLATTHEGIFDVVSIIGFIAMLAIIIACLGLLGMATYIAERRRKEVGIRKVLGAEEFGIAALLSRDFVIMLGISICIGAPLSYIINNFWLQKFPNRVEFGLGTVGLGVSALLALGLLTIASQTFRVSRTNPVESLRAD